MIQRVLIGAVAATALALPAAAQADTYCVRSTACPEDHREETLEPALIRAAQLPGRDTILIGAGTLDITQIYVGPANPVDIRGEGAGATQLTGSDPGSTNRPVLQLAGTSTVSGLGLNLGNGTDSVLRLGDTSSALGVTVDAAAAGSAIGVYLDGNAGLSNSRVSANQNSRSAAVFAEPGGTTANPVSQTVRIADVHASGGSALHTSAGSGGVVDAQRLRLEGVSYGAVSSSQQPNTQPGKTGGTLRLSSCLITVGDFGETGLLARNGTVDAHHLTIVGPAASSPGDTAGVQAEPGRDGAGGALSSRLSLRDSIVDGFRHSLRRLTSTTADVNVDVDYTNLDKKSIIPASGPGYTFGANNRDVTPVFQDATDYRLASASPLIDAGPTSLSAFESTTDLAGATRLADGNDDGIERSDFGAYEYPDPTPPANPGTGGSSGSGGSSGGAESGATPPSPGAPGAPSAKPSLLDTTAPTVTSPSLARSTFSVASASTALTAAARGTTLRYRLSEPARVRIAVERRGTGASVKRGKRRVCLARTKARGKAKRCTRYTSVRTLTRNGKAGPNTLDFTGRLAGRALSPGRYRFVITATDSAGNRSKPRTIAFRIVR